MSAVRAGPAPVRAGLLLHGLDRPLSGVTRVALELARALSRTDGCEVVPLTTYRHGPFREASRQAVYLPGCERVPGVMAFGGPLVSIAARRRALDLVHDPVGVSPFTLGRWAGRYRRILTIHDAIAFRYPEGYAWANNFLHRRFVPATLRNVDVIVTVSEHARLDIERFLRVPRARIAVIHNGVDERFRPIPANDARTIASRYGLEREFILHVGVPQRRKNIPRLVEAFRQIRARWPQVELVLVGPGTARLSSLIEEQAPVQARHGIRLLGAVADGDLPALYSAARLFVFPSLYEGFGLPVLEAMACGTPVVSSDATSLPEVAGDAALLVDARNHDALAAAIDRLLGDEPLRTELRRRGIARAATFTWGRAARSLLELYSTLLPDGIRRKTRA